MSRNNEYTILGIEGTAHTLGMGIIRGKKILTDKRQMFAPDSGGIHPREAARMMNDNFPFLLSQAISDANIEVDEIDAVAFSQGPGLGPCLRTCATGARTISLLIDKPLIGVNHPLAHVELAIMLTNTQDPLILYVSGGNTQLIVYGSQNYRVIGETQDIALGNMLDQFGRELGLPHPGGPKIEQLAQKGTKLLDLPYAVKGMDVSYSGILTAANELYKKSVGEKNNISKFKADLCFSLQEYSFAMITEVLERALVATEKDSIIITGGVAANQRMCEMLNEVAEDQNVDFFPIPIKMAADNGVMIAWTGHLYFNYNHITPIEKSNVDANYRIEEADVLWR